MSSSELVNDVRDELYWDPKIDNSAIAVSADDGRVTLRGTVGSLREKRNAKLDAGDLSVTTASGGDVTIEGTVSSWAEHDQAIAAAWAAPGVTKVHDRMAVAY
jgi:osmotically-inducible protein OsmY